MGRYVLRRLLIMIPMILGITLIAFILMQLAPGDYLTSLKENPQVSRATVEKMAHEFGLDRPAPEQYVRWLWNVVWHRNFGTSFSEKMPVFDVLMPRLFNTLLLSLCAMFFSWILAIPIGVYCAVKQYSWLDKILTLFSYSGVALPSFFVALLLMLLANAVGLPVAGMQDWNHTHYPFWQKLVDTGRHLFFPVLALGIGSLAGLIRQMRANLLDMLRAEFVNTARAKGLAERVVIWKHAVRNAVNPLITIFGFELGGLLSGALMVEIVMAWPGVGRMMYEALLREDLYLVMGNLVLSGGMLMCGNLISDVLLAMSDPRIKYE